MPKTAANSSDQADLDRVEVVEEEKLDVQYQAAIQSLLNRATEIGGEGTEASATGGGTVSPSEGAEIGAGAVENAETSTDPTDVDPDDGLPMSNLPSPRSRPSETSDQLRDLRHIANASARTAITTHAARRRKQILLPIYVAIPLGLLALILSPWILPGGVSTLAMLGISLAVIVVAVRGFLALRELNAASSSSQEPPDPASHA